MGKTTTKGRGGLPQQIRKMAFRRRRPHPSGEGASASGSLPVRQGRPPHGPPL